MTRVRLYTIDPYTGKEVFSRIYERPEYTETSLVKLRAALLLRRIERLFLLAANRCRDTADRLCGYRSS